jgi:hypothetical protein
LIVGVTLTLAAQQPSSLPRDTFRAVMLGVGVVLLLATFPLIFPFLQPVPALPRIVFARRQVQEQRDGWPGAV